jgi:putative ABC transport system permease protein
VYMNPPATTEVLGDPAVEAVAQVDRLAARVSQLAAGLEEATVIPLRKAFLPGETAIVVGDSRVRPTIDLSRRVEARMWRPESQLFVATPAMLRYLGIDPATIDPGTDFLADASVPTDQLEIPKPAGTGVFAVTNVQRIELGGRLFGNPWHEWAPETPTFITRDGLRRHGWGEIPAGWLVESGTALTGDQIADARALAADAGFTLEVKHEADSRSGAMAIATAAGALLALGILALAVGLIRSESAGDVRTLTATGATARIRRKLTATTAGALALAAALLGVGGAYVVLLATYHDDLGYLGDVPVLHLAVAVIGVPLAAGAAGWLLAGREPPAIARAVIE